MQNVSNLSILAMLIMYMLSALFGYLTFYGRKRRPPPPAGRLPLLMFTFLCPTGRVEAELLHTFTKVYKFDTLLLLVRLAVLTAVTLTVPIVLFPVSTPCALSDLTGGLIGFASEHLVLQGHKHVPPS